ncbi:glycosyltransferase [Paeniglutamicibacter psychrophenolicus]|uniref:glycosyltransferase n=1 Tax=Paeniglutamicibacter psychrophenolicus TaxID=257454 RepID=UPI0027886646|nr:glycosyltransferase [Paeniglutamicibacter psychrophenolicus]MDQ0094666.1 glycosyltransferase involved in cell wall biosynthesis [Paeniglutamicibacter psychrophenolicus]
MAPNSLYRQNVIRPSVADGDRHCLIYVGRFEKAKKLDLVIRAFALATDRMEGAKLLLIGGGSMEERLREICSELGLGVDLVEFVGWIDDVEDLRTYYSRSFASASPGFAGLGLTQSLGFGIPMIVAEDEEHSPEIELGTDGRVSWFASDNPAQMADKIVVRWQSRGNVPIEEASAFVRNRYSADAMSKGLAAALTGRDETYV